MLLLPSFPFHAKVDRLRSFLEDAQRKLQASEAQVLTGRLTVEEMIAAAADEHRQRSEDKKVVQGLSHLIPQLVQVFKDLKAVWEEAAERPLGVSRCATGSAAGAGIGATTLLELWRGGMHAACIEGTPDADAVKRSNGLSHFESNDLKDSVVDLLSIGLDAASELKILKKKASESQAACSR
jgi:hypothetical protein